MDLVDSFSPVGTTFKGKYGCVDYWVKAFLDRPSVATQEIKKHFEVMDQIDVGTPDLMVITAGVTPVSFRGRFSGTSHHKLAMFQRHL